MPGFFLEDINTFVKNANGKEIRAADARFKDPDKPYIFTSIVNAQKEMRALPAQPSNPSIRRILFEFYFFRR